MKPTPTDLELVHGLQTRSADAFSRVYADHHAGIYNLCARILDDREEARDVTQDVFIKAFNSPPAAQGDVKLRAWLYRVATNACFNVIRGRRSSGGLGEAEEVASIGDPYEQAQSVALIEQSLGRLNERYRAALVLKDLHGLDGAELADVLEVSRPAADVLVHRARASFRKAFAALSGEGSVAPANLAMALPVLTVPVTLQVLPPLPAAFAPPPAATPGPAPLGPAAPTSSGHGLDPSAIAGPAAAGILAKLAAAVGTKAAIVAGGAVLVAGGGLAIREAKDHGAAGGSSGVAAAAVVTPAGHVPDGDAHHAIPESPHDAWATHRHDAAAHVAEAAHHRARRAHKATHRNGGHGSGHDTDDASPPAASTHDSAQDATTSSGGHTSSTPDAHSDASETPSTHEGDDEH